MKSEEYQAVLKFRRTWNFVKDSNAIEGIYRDPTDEEIAVFDNFMELSEVKVSDLYNFVRINEPGAVLRDRVGLDVMVGNHTPPLGGPEIRRQLQDIIEDIKAGLSPFETHLKYERLHPFTDCNGRSGRMLWMWQMREIKGRFLQEFYYQSLEFYDA